jgi:methionyl-tRNA formyltransferase
MILKKEVDILPDDTYETLHDKLAMEGKSAIIDALKLIENGNVNAKKQDDNLSSYAHMITKETAKIDWNKSAEEINNLVRGLYPFPKAMTLYNGKLLKVIKTELCSEKTDKIAGTIIKTNKESIFVSCGNNTVIKIKNIQLEGKKAMSVKDFLVGNEVQTGIVLGN